jgi:hypothetical protein
LAFFKAFILSVPWLIPPIARFSNIHFIFTDFHDTG